MPGWRRQRHMVLGIRFGYTLFQRTRVHRIHEGRHTRSKHGKHGRRAQHTCAANAQHARLSTSAQHGMYAGENRGDQRARVCRSEHRQSMDAVLTQLHHMVVRCVEDTCIDQSLDETYESQGARPRQIPVAWRSTRGQHAEQTHIELHRISHGLEGIRRLDENRILCGARRDVHGIALKGTHALERRCTRPRCWLLHDVRTLRLDTKSGDSLHQRTRWIQRHGSTCLRVRRQQVVEGPERTQALVRAGRTLGHRTHSMQGLRRMHGHPAGLLTRLGHMDEQLRAHLAQVRHDRFFVPELVDRRIVARHARLDHGRRYRHAARYRHWHSSWSRCAHKPKQHARSVTAAKEHLAAAQARRQADGVVRHRRRPCERHGGRRRRHAPCSPWH